MQVTTGGNTEFGCEWRKVILSVMEAQTGQILDSQNIVIPFGFEMLDNWKAKFAKRRLRNFFVYLKADIVDGDNEAFVGRFLRTLSLEASCSDPEFTVVGNTKFLCKIRDVNVFVYLLDSPIGLLDEYATYVSLLPQLFVHGLLLEQSQTEDFAEHAVEVKRIRARRLFQLYRMHHNLALSQDVADPELLNLSVMLNDDAAFVANNQKKLDAYFEQQVLQYRADHVTEVVDFASTERHRLICNLAELNFLKKRVFSAYEDSF